MRKDDREYLQRVAELGCVVCRNLGYGASPAEIHHLRKGCGVGQRSSHRRAIPLCPPHHRTGGHGVAIHAGQKTWEKIYGSEEELLEQVKRELRSDLS
ncbi:Ref family recombination enhancement nuclease [Serratia liquefaciens]|uniref:DUF968 domain-containing protein n=1 Tax=Serratia liquefaciens TaxID=614 RepID=A0A515CTH0_SERLI|nr:Ref family recombination enhancement nuclease [Serratia liquefaciens]QDL31469.1 hypothetical protein EGO53_06600 [Serratia liquefaciens]